jgi:FG-GAP-like repeat
MLVVLLRTKAQKVPLYSARVRSFLFLSAAGVLLAAPPVKFAEHSIGDGLKGGYQLVAADLNHDGKPDLIALASGLDELVWYENPGWQRHVITRGLVQMINLALVGDTMVLADRFSSNPAKSEGRVYVLQPQGDVRREWSRREIDRLPTAHRFRPARLRQGAAVINAPLADPKATVPDYVGHIPLVMYRPPDWKREVITEQEQGVMHGIFLRDADGDGFDELYTASFLGIHEYKQAKDLSWQRRKLGTGEPVAWPPFTGKGPGSSDVAISKQVTAAIEPWHGNIVAVYEKGKRRVLDTSLREGHTVEIADFNGDGREEFVIGDRGRVPNGPAQGGVYLFHREKDWVKTPIDGTGMAAASCVVLDLNGDRRPDVACIGSATANLKWYENMGKGQ